MRRGSWFFAAGLVAAALSSAGGRAGSGARPRNLVLIPLDTMRADRLPAYGFTGVRAPALDRLASSGVVFENAFAPVPLTLPSHASLFTGRYPPHHGVRDNAGKPLSNRFTTLAEVLRGHGLKTAAFVASSVLAPNQGLEQGFDRYSAGNPGPCSDARRRSDDVVDDAIAWFTAHDRDPFFAWIHLYDTHRPYDLPAEYRDRYIDPYLAAIAYEDAQIARLLGPLEARGTLTDTLVIVAGDHGESLGDHGEDSHGIFLYRETLRVPLLLSGTGISPRRVTRVARLIDVMPTVLDLLGLPSPALDGVSRAAENPGSAASEVYSESMYPTRFGWASLRSLQADRYKVIAAPRVELYDLERDPTEQRNLAKERPAVVNAMLQRLRTFDSNDNAAPREGGDADDALVDRIAALGYVGRGRLPVAEPTALVDPKDRIGAFNRITSLQWDAAQRRSSLCR